ncbi:hypothetical protein [Stenotrophomonas sp.]|uniref:hypothetical protein n=1 Tax=Stenotrophomonas sp. TaxID=69392 RepID=UPI002FC8D872
MSPNVIPSTALEDKATLALQDKLDRILAKAKPTKRELMQQHFRDLYPRIESHLASGKLLKDVLAAFNELTQAKVCARTFNDMVDQERSRRDAASNPVCCIACGQPLNAAARQTQEAEIDGFLREPTAPSSNDLE